MRAFLVVLLLVSAGVPGVAAQSSSTGGGNEFTKEDGTGDVGLRGGPSSGGPGGIPSSPVTDSFDLLSLRIYGEDLEGFHIDVKVKSLKRSPGYVWGNQRYSTDFRLEGGTTSYFLEWAPLGYSRFDGNDTPTMGTRFCVRNQGDNYGCNRQRALGGADYAQNVLTAYIPKRSLMGLDPVQGGKEAAAPILLGPGSILGQFVVRAYSDSYFLEDRLPDSGATGPYIFQQAAANGRVGLALHKGNETKEENPFDYYANQYMTDAGDFPRVAAEPGNSTRVEVAVTNRNGGKRLLNLDASIEGADTKGRWEVRIAPSVQVPGNETRVVNLIVITNDKVQHRDTALVHVVAKSAGYPDEIGALTLRLVSSAPLSLSHPTFYLHGAQRAQQVWEQGFCSTPLPFFGSCQDQVWMNTLEVDPTGKADASGFRAYNEWNGQQNAYRYEFKSDTKLTRDLVLDPRQPIKANIKVRAPNVAGSLEFGLQAGARSLGQVSVAVPAGSGSPQDVPVTFLPLSDASRVPVGTELRVRVALRFPVQGMATPPAIFGQGSFITLPAIEDPQAPPAPPVALGDAFLSLSLKTDAEEFMNPGKSKAYRIVIVNEGNLTDDVRTLANITEGGCGAAIRPGDQFRLEAGDSVRLDVLVRVADDAKEGSQCKTEFTAISGVDPAFRARLILTTIATTGADFEDEAANYTADEDARGKLRGSRTDSSTPAPGLLLVAAAALAVAILSRRRLQP
ncbi:MAG TPA: hypothetical protein VI818_07830 [Candidatus Thermoplasmatota archaeon]|nr:hypothetical protein [Candidatus Thermoplasmatota archaeon]